MSEAHESGEIHIQSQQCWGRLVAAAEMGTWVEKTMQGPQKAKIVGGSVGTAEQILLQPKLAAREPSWPNPRYRTRQTLNK